VAKGLSCTSSALEDDSFGMFHVLSAVIRRLWQQEAQVCSWEPYVSSIHALQCGLTHKGWAHLGSGSLNSSLSFSLL